MRIVIGIESYLPHLSGVVTFVQRLVPYLARQGHQVVIVTTASKAGLPFEEKDPDGVLIYRFPGWENPLRRDVRVSYLRNRAKVEKIVDQFNPNIIHCQDIGVINGFLLDWAAKKRVAVITHHHFSMEFILGYFKTVKFLFPLIRFFVKARCRKFYNRCQLVMTPTEFTKNTILAWGLKTPVVAVSNGIEAARFNPVDTEKEVEGTQGIRNRFLISSHQPIVVYLGRMDKDKDIQTLVQAIPHVLDKVQATFLFAGEGTDRKELESWVARYHWKDQVKFAGYVPSAGPDVPLIYQASSVAWIASVIETQSITTLEAMAVGLPVVAANAGALPELVHDNQNGFLVEPGNVEGFADAVLKILQSPELAKKFGEESKRIASGHAIEKSFKRFEEIYEDAVKKEKPQRPAAQ